MLRLKISVLVLLESLCVALLCGCNKGDEILLTTTPSTDTLTETTETVYNQIPDETHPENFKVFVSDGITLTLPEEFNEVPDQDRPVYYSGYSFVSVTREPFTTHPSLAHMTLDEYCNALIASRSMDSTVRVQGGLHWFDYEVKSPEADQPATFFVVVYQTNTDFWIVEFASDSRSAIRLRPYFFKWAKMIEFTEQMVQT